MKTLTFIKKSLYVSLCGGMGLYVYADTDSLKSLSSAVNSNWAVLGAPTFYATSMPTSNTMCMNTSNVTLGSSPSVGFNFNSAITSTQLNSALDLGLGLDLPFLESYGITANASANFAASTVNNQYTYNYTYLYTYTTTAKLNTSFGNDNLSTNGINALNAGQSAFLQTCGDSFVGSLNAGAVLAVNVSITLQDKEQAAKFGESTNIAFGETPLANITQSINANSSSIGQNSIMSVSILQNGGTPESLGNGGFFAEPCQVKDTAACERAINGIIAYALTLPNQVKDTNGNLIESHLYFNSPSLQSYASVGVGVPVPQPLSPAVQAAQAAVVEQINLSQERINFLQNYLHSGLNLSPDVTNFINSQSNHLQARIDYIAKKSVDCFNANAASCPAIVADIKTRISAGQMYAFDNTQYTYLNTAIQYMYNGKPTIIVPTSFYGAYNTLANGYPNQVGLYATVYRSPQPDNYITEIDIPDIDFLIVPSMNKCFPISSSDGAATSRTFRCTDGLLKPAFNLQFQTIKTPL